MTERGTGHVVQEEIGEEASNEKLIEVYKTWCTTYDKDVIKDFGYCGWQTCAELLSAKLKEFGFPLNARILDLGAGTGMVGGALHKLGHKNIDAVDMSAESLQVAKEKGVYRNLIRGFMASENSQDLGVEAKQYDAGICAGVFTLAHVKGKGFDDFIHAVKPGGLACFSVRNDVLNNPKYGYNEKMEELCREKKWKVLHKELAVNRTDENLLSCFYVCQVL